MRLPGMTRLSRPQHRWWAKLLTVVLACLVVAIFVYFAPLMLMAVAARPKTVLAEEHTGPDFTLYVTEQAFLGTSHRIQARSRRSLIRYEVASVFAGNWFDTPSIDSSTLSFEWHEQEHLVALRGATHRNYTSLMYLALLQYDAEGTVSEVPVEAEVADGLGDNWGSAMRQARHLEIERILAGGTESTDLSTEPIPTAIPLQGYPAP